LDTGETETLGLDSQDSDTTEPPDIQDTETEDTGWPAGEWVAALQWKGLTFDTIQDAIVDATDGDTVLVAPGNHYENIDFHGKGIHVRSTHGASATIINGGLDGSVVSIRAMEPATAILEGFTISHGLGSEGHGGGVFVENADPLIVHNIFTLNQANIAAGVYLRHGEAIVRNNLVIRNDAGEGGGGIVCTNCKGAFYYNTLVDNDSREGPAGEWYFEPQGDLIGHVIVLKDGASHAIRYQEALGYSFSADYNLLWPDVPWSAPGQEEWPQGVGILAAEPIFLDASGWDYRLSDASPGVDAGPVDDLDADGTRADMGAFGGPDGDWSPDRPNHTWASRPKDTGTDTQ
jgi:hypothetical protein